MDERKHMLHNANTAHIKILPEEAEALGKILAERLSKVTYPVKTSDSNQGNETQHTGRTGIIRAKEGSDSY